MEWTRWECRPWYEADDSIGGIVVYTELITRRKQVEEKLREREELFASVVGQAMDAVALVDIDGRFVEFNTAAHDGLGYTYEEFAALSRS